MNKKIFLITIIILTILIISIMITIGILQQSKTYKEEKEMEELDEGIVEISIESKLKEVKIRNNYYIVKRCVRKFYSYLMEYENNENEVNNSKELILNILDEEYIKFKNISKENISQKIPQIKTSIINITNMYISQQKVNIDLYFVQGTLREKSSGKITKFELMIKLDKKNRTFSVFLEDYYRTEFKEFPVEKEIVLKDIEDIEKNEDNIFSYESISEEEYVKDLISKYKEEALYNTELAYEHLHEEYRNKRFKTKDGFKKYIDSNIANIVKLNLSSYKKTARDDYIQYICKDQNGKYYIFREKSVMNYELILDTYTIELPEVIENYNKLINIEKAGYNVQICIEAINNKDYSYIYSKLDNEFKQNNYKTEESFIKVIEKNLYEKNKAENISSTQEGDIYIYQLKLVDEDDNTKEQEMTFIIKLKEGTDFVMSFNIK